MSNFSVIVILPIELEVYVMKAPRRTLSLLLTLLTFTLVLFFSSSSFGAAPAETAEAPSSKSRGPWDWGAPVPGDRDWTILVYLDGDNNLEEWALTDLKEMEQGLPEGGKVEVVVLLDRAKGYSDEMGDWTGTRAYRVKRSTRKDAIGSELIADCGERNMGAPETLEAFVQAAVRKFPARRTALVLWNHGMGWISMASDEDAPGAVDGVDALTLSGLRGVLSRVAPSLPGGKLDLLTFDMCLMAQLEVAAACAPFARYMVAGATILPSVGMDYLAALPLFTQGLDTGEIARRMVGAGCKGFLKIHWDTASLTAFDLSKADALISACAKFAGKLGTLAPKAWSDVTRTLFYAMNYIGPGDYREKGDAVSSVDLMDWLRRLSAMPCGTDLKGEIAAVEKAVSPLILATESGPSIPLSRGLSLYAPLRADNVRPGYEETDFDRAVGWSKALAAVYAMQKKEGMDPPKIVSVELGSPVPKQGVGTPRRGADYAIEPSSEFVPLSGTAFSGMTRSYLKATLEGKNILWGYCGFAFSRERDGEYVQSLSQLLPAENINPDEETTDIGTPVFRDGRNELLYQLAGLLHYFSNGESRSLVQVDAVDVSNPKLITVSGLYSSPGLGKDIPVQIGVESDFGSIVSMAGVVTDAGGKMTVVAITPKPQDVFRPLLNKIADGKLVQVVGDPIEWKDGLSVVVEPVPAGSWMRVLVQAESLGGEGDIHIAPPVRAAENPMVTPYLKVTQERGYEHFLGRYAAVGIVPSRTGTNSLLAPNGAVLEIEQASGREMAFAATLSAFGSDPVHLRLLVQPEGLPIVRSVVPGEGGALTLVKSDFALLVPEEGRYSWRMIDCASGSHIQLIPLDDLWFPAGYLEGEWSGDDGSTLTFRGGQAGYAPAGGALRQGSFTLSDNRVTLTPSDGQPLVLFTAYNPETKALVVTFADTETATVYNRQAGSPPHPQPPHPDPSQPQYPSQSVPPQPQVPPQGATLDGVWGAFVNGQQLVMQIQGNQYGVWVNGMPSEAGVFQIQGNRMYGQTNTGAAFSNLFQWDPSGMAFAITAPNGFTIVYQRMQ
ncbi:hypothetical protein EII26_04950 [Fretibacterium sp. OH1220_COT-178]|nr:hypothetical protein EII26_04950 [Fretibacterium sp. OH1220_COT-178]